MRHWVAEYEWDDGFDEETIRVGYEGTEIGFSVVTEDGTNDELGEYMTVEEACDRIEMLFGSLPNFRWLKK